MLPFVIPFLDSVKLGEGLPPSFCEMGAVHFATWHYGVPVLVAKKTVVVDFCGLSFL